VERYGAGPTVFDILREQQNDDEGFMLLLELFNIIDNERAAARAGLRAQKARTAPPTTPPRPMRGRRGRARRR